MRSSEGYLCQILPLTLVKNIKSSLAFVCHKPHPIHVSFEIWVMDEFGVDGMRKKLVTVECSQRFQWPLAFWKNEVVIMADRVGKLCCYDFGTQEIKELPSSQASHKLVFCCNLHEQSRFSQRRK